MQRQIKIIIVLLLLTISVFSQQRSFSELTGPYLGQKPPEMIPVIFAPNIISFGFHEHSIAISPDGNEIFYVMTDAKYYLYRICHVKFENNQWTSPKIASFKSNYNDLCPVFSPDGKKLYFTSNRPLKKYNEVDDISRIWYIEKRNNTWSNPKYLHIPVDSNVNIVNPSVSDQGTLFFQSKKADGNWDIYFSYWDGSKYSIPKKLSNGINTEYNESAPFIAPDESFILFHSNRPGGFGGMDIYVSFKLENSWSEPINLGNQINSEASDWKPTLSPDGRYLFFSSYRSLNQSNLTGMSYDELLDEYNSPLNNYGTLFWVNARILSTLKEQLIQK